MRLFLLCILFTGSYSLFEDQIGKFDWRQQFIGCPRNVVFDRSTKGGDRLLVSTKENVFASLALSSGAINWRRLQESSSTDEVTFAKDIKNLYTISDSGRILRAWNKATGAMRWQKVLEETTITSAPRIALSGESVIALAAGVVHSFSISGDEQWKTVVGPSSWSELVVSSGSVIHVSIESTMLTAKKISSTGQVSSTQSTAIKTSSLEKCVVSGSSVVCHHSESLTSVDVTKSALNALEKSTGLNIRRIDVLDATHIAVISPETVVVFSSTDLKEVTKVVGKVEAIALSDRQLVTISAGKLSVIDITTGKQTLSVDVPSANVPASALFVESVKKEIEAVIVYTDCRVEMVVVSPSTTAVHSEWQREEALARINSVEMVDLPLSESQQMIEDEFEEQGGNAISSFVRRIVSQGVQLQKGIVNAVHQLFSLSKLASLKANSFSELLEAVRSTSKASNGRGQPLERDFFNLRKMVVVSSLDGVVFGLDSSDGTVIWRLWLGDRFVPLQSSFGDLKVPLFIQRSTAHYQLNGQGVVAFKDAVSLSGSLLFFNPITGAVLERKQLTSPIERVDLLPFAGNDHIHSVLVLETGDKVSMHPPLAHELASAAAPIHIIRPSGKGVAGAQVNLVTKKINQLWNTDLQLTSSSNIIAIKGKPAEQKLHSQGRVLIDREVQYKYNNPNLVAVASLDSEQQVLNIFMIDAVTGQIVYTSKLQKAGAPVHLVHCENWVVYSYWSEKSRRTEIGVVELYEGGEEQSSPEKFDSLVPTRRAPEVNAAGYIYPQGVEAMAVTDTEQGLTTRSILLALPFGGIHEVSRKLLDANRPLELTQEMREEMMIPYMPEIMIATEDMINYNQTVHRVKGMKTAPSGLESTSLMLAYGIDVFFTRLHPSGTFDILKDDFDHLLISLVLFALVVGSVVSKRFARNNALKAAWA